jgi:hypothetical protein
MERVANEVSRVRSQTLWRHQPKRRSPEAAFLLPADVSAKIWESGLQIASLLPADVSAKIWELGRLTVATLGNTS